MQPMPMLCALLASTTLACAALAQAPSGPSAPGGTAPGHGQLLYETFCVQCHMSQLHWRDAGAARDWPSLREQVDRWQAQTGQQWRDEDIDAVALYLNDTVYHFRPPQQRDGTATPAPAR